MAGAKLPRERKLPVQQLTILAICRFAEPIASTSLFPYLPEMIKSFNVPENEIGKWAGTASAMFSLCQAIMGIPWSRFSDRYGRKPAILLGLASTMITSLMWGFAKTLPFAILARGLAGAGNGNVGIIRTTVAEMVPFKELQPRAFSLMPLVWNIGSIFGPSIGGALANPYNIRPREQVKNPNLFQMYPYALPNIVAACLFLVGIVTGILFLDETLARLQYQRDYGRILGRKITSVTKRHVLKVEELLHLREPKDKGLDGQHEPLLKQDDDEEALRQQRNLPAPTPPTYREVLNKQAILNLVVYTLLALHSMAYDQLLPVFMQYPPIGKPRKHMPPKDPNNPLQFAGGFGLDHTSIGLISTSYGICAMLCQFFLFPPIARRFGVLNCLKACAIAFPISYFITPFTALLPTLESQVGCCFAVILLKQAASIFAFPCSTILLTNSATGLRTLGTLNGFATSFSAIGRACGPFLGGAMFTAGVKNGYVIVPWWLFSAIGIIAAIPVWLLVEGEGFGGDDDQVSDEEEIEDEEQLLRAEALEGEAEAGGKPGPILFPNHEQIEEQEEVGYGTMGPLSRTTTMSSALTLGSDEYLSPQGSRSAWLDGSETAGPSTGMPSTRPQGGSRGPSLSRRNSRRIVRKSSIPIGMGNQGISRRYSSNLGQSLGSAGGLQ